MLTITKKRVRLFLFSEKASETKSEYFCSTIWCHYFERGHLILKCQDLRSIINIKTLVQDTLTSLLDELKKNGKKVTKGEICPHILDQPTVFNATNLVEILTIVRNDTPLKSRRFYQYLKCFQDRV